MSLDCSISPTLNVITGPNAAGKTSLGRITDIVVSALECCYTQNWQRLEQSYGGAGRYGASPWSVRLGVAFGDEDLRGLDDWVRGSLISSMPRTQNLPELTLTRLILDAGDVGTTAMFSRGEFIVEYDRNRRQPWQVTWRTRVTVSWSGARAAEPLNCDNPQGSVAHPAQPGTWVWQSDTEIDTTDKSLEVTLRLDTGSLLHVAGTPLRSNRAITFLLSDAVRHAQHGAGMPVSEHLPVPDTFRLPTVIDLVMHGGIDLHVALTGSEPEPDPIRRLMASVGVSLIGTSRTVGFAEVTHKLLTRILSVTANHRLPPETRFGTDHLAQGADLASGVNLALALHQDKNSELAYNRKRFAATQKYFTQLTSPDLCLDVTARAFYDSTREFGEATILTPIVIDDIGDVPLHLSGAGRAEAAYLAAVLAYDWSCLILDEPATNLSPTAQRQVLNALRDRTRRGLQTLLITHSSHLVPTDTVDEVSSILRLVRAEHHTEVHRPGPSEALQALLPRLRLADVRDALFAAGVLLVEGATDLGLVQVWFDQEATPTARTANVVIISVNSDTGFVPYMQLMDQIGVPWAALVDGPALSNTLPRYVPVAPINDFQAAKAFWSDRGVYTVAEEFGIGERKGHGEIEKFLETHDAAAFAQASAEGRRNKPQVGRVYAENVGMPPEFAEIWARVLVHLGVS